MDDPMTFTIEDGSLLKCKGPNDVIIPEGVTKIGAEAFMGCNLTRVIIPERVTEIGERAFKNWESLIGVTIPEGVTKIGSEAFAGCTGLTSITIPESVTGIGALAFRDCEGLTSVTIPGDATEIEEHAFEGCWGLTDVIVSKSIKNLDEAWFTEHFGDGVFTALIAPHIPIEYFHPDDRYAACCGFAKLYFEGAEIDEDIRAGYLKYMKGQGKTLYDVAVWYQELLHLMLAEKMVPWEEVHLLLEECCQWNSNAVRDAMQYIQNFPPVDWAEETDL